VGGGNFGNNLPNIEGAVEEGFVLAIHAVIPLMSKTAPAFNMNTVSPVFILKRKKRRIPRTRYFGGVGDWGKIHPDHPTADVA
jgi:hypothetical protein